MVNVWEVRWVNNELRLADIDIYDSYIEVFPTLVAENYDIFCIQKYSTIINREK